MISANDDSYESDCIKERDTMPSGKGIPEFQKNLLLLSVHANKTKRHTSQTQQPM